MRCKKAVYRLCTGNSKQKHLTWRTVKQDARCTCISMSHDWFSGCPGNSCMYISRSALSSLKQSGESALWKTSFRNQAQTIRRKLQWVRYGSRWTCNSIWQCERVGKHQVVFYPKLPDSRKCTVEGPNTSTVCPSDKIMVPWWNDTDKKSGCTRIKTRLTATLPTSLTAFLRPKFTWIPFKHPVRTAQ